MRAFAPTLLTLLATVVTAQSASAQPVRVRDTVRVDTTSTVTMTIGGPVGGPVLPTLSDVVVVGKVVELEPDTVAVAPYRGGPKEQLVSYKVAHLKIEDRVRGASGVTQVRVGFSAEAPALLGPGADTGRTGRAITATVAVGPQPMGIGLAPGLEGCFYLAKHPTADFYLLVGLPVQKKDPGYAKQVDRLKQVARILDEPVEALKSKDLNERFEAAQMILQRYRTPRGSNMREAVPDEENKLILVLLAELPWVPADGKRVRPDGRMVPHREALWYALNPGEFGFKRPDVPKRQPGDPPVEMTKLMDEATTKFLKENADKIKLKRFVQK
jgi:hypothetical protein